MLVLPKERLDYLLEYKPNEGRFIWKWDKGSKVKAGDEAGMLHHSGYRHIKVDGKRYLEHRLIWLAETGEMPKGEIDHINLDKTDNRIENLRESDRSKNCHYKRKQTSIQGINTASKWKGVTYSKVSKTWRARITHCGKRYYLGDFAKQADAAQAYNYAAYKYFREHAYYNV